MNNLISEHVCQNSHHTDEKPAYGQVTVHFWDGSEYEMKQASLYICDECGKNIVSYLEKQLGKNKILSDIIEM